MAALPVSLLLTLLTLLTLLLTDDAVLASSQLQQGLVGGLLRFESRLKWVGTLVRGGLRQLLDGFQHAGPGCRDVFGRLGVGDALGQLLELLQLCLLRLGNQSHVAIELLRQALADFTTDDLPSCADDLLLILRCLLGLLRISVSLLVTLLLLLSLRRLVALSEDLFERPYLDEEHVAGSAADLAVGIEFLGPEVVADQLVFFGA